MPTTPTTPDGSQPSSQSSSEDQPRSEQRSLREWRVLRGMTQQQLAFATGLSISTVRDVELGRHEPSLGTARRIFRALNITLEQVAFADT